MFGAVARRVDLDAALLDVARAAGVKVHDGHAVTDAGLERRRRSPCRSTASGEVTAPFAVAADGMWSPLRKAFGCSDEAGYLGEWHAFRQYFTGVGPAATGQLWVWFEEDLLPGYAWSFALPGGVANVGFGIHRRSGSPTSEMKALWADLLQRPHIRAVLGPACQPEAPHKAWPIPARIGGTQLVAAGGRVLFVGDAARAPDSMTGEGIGQALETGQLAAAAIAAGGPRRPGAVAERYQRSVKTGLAIDDSVALALSRVLGHSRGRGAQSAWPAPPTGRAATSPAGCSRTTRGRSWPRPAAGTRRCCTARAPSARRALTRGPAPAPARSDIRQHRARTKVVTRYALAFRHATTRCPATSKS